MMTDRLRSKRWKTTYRSETDSILKDLYIPALSIARSYHRSVGYFTSGSLAHAARGINSLIQSGGTLELIASPVLEEQDIKAMQDGYGSREDILRQIISRTFVPTESTFIQHRLEALAWLIAESRMDIKIAFRVDEQGNCKPGIYHEKIGVIRDGFNDFLAFSGSANESVGGLLTNFESIPVHWSWDDPQERAKEIEGNWYRLWLDRTNGLRVISFTDVTADLLSKYKRNRKPRIDEEAEDEIDVGIAFPSRDIDGFMRMPRGIVLRDYQAEVIKGWFKNNGRGVFSLATGTGKTITALSAVQRLHSNEQLEALLVLCPYQNLVEQWQSELRSFFVDPIVAYRSKNLWYDHLAGKLASQRTVRDPLLAVVTTFATFSTTNFQTILDAFPSRSMLIADEAHHMGSETRYGRLPVRGFPFRLGLSATPDRWQDEEGTERIFDWFGDVVPPAITVSDAIDMKALCPYKYYPVFIDLAASEAIQLRELTSRVSRLIDKGHKPGQSRELGAAVNARSQFMDTLESKSEALRRLVGDIGELKKALIYCGVGRIDSDDEIDDQESIRHVDHIVSLLGDECGKRVARYTAETHVHDRQRMIKQLANDDLQAIVAINCLDEGVDIPCVETAIILSSSANPRQFVQRRGRVLRKFPGKHFATIYDMVVIPKFEGQLSDTEHRLLSRELSRYLEFARSAINATEAEAAILPIQSKYGLLHL